MEDLGDSHNEIEENILPLVTPKKIPFHIMDMHEEVMELVIIPAIEEDHILSNTTNTVISFNAHVDVLVPADMQFKSRLQPSVSKPGLFKNMGKQYWIKELAEKMRMLNIIWVKPPWTKGVDDCHRSFTIKDKSGTTHDVNLHVKTLGHSIFKDVEEDFVGFKEVFNKDLDSNHPYILDLELSFFSSDNSFTREYEKWPEYYQFFKEIFKIKYPESKDEEVIKNVVEENRKNLTELKQIFDNLKTHKTLPPIEGEQSILHEKISHLREELLKHYEENEIRWDHIYDAGLVCTDHQMPVHFTDRADIEKMVNECVAKVVDLLPCPPRVVIVAIMYEYLNFTREEDLDFIIDLLKELFAKKFPNLDRAEFIGY